MVTEMDQVIDIEITYSLIFYDIDSVSKSWLGQVSFIVCIVDITFVQFHTTYL